MPRPPFWAIFATAFAFLLSPLYASNLQYTRSLWRTVDGLPEATVQALTETPDGVLRVGTTEGLASFDGARIRGFNPAGMQALGVHSIFCLARDRDGSLWAGTEGGGLLHIRGLNVTRFLGQRRPDGHLCSERFSRLAWHSLGGYG